MMAQGLRWVVILGRICLSHIYTTVYILIYGICWFTLWGNCGVRVGDAERSPTGNRMRFDPEAKMEFNSLLWYYLGLFVDIVFWNVVSNLEVYVSLKAVRLVMWVRDFLWDLLDLGIRLWF